MAKTYKEWEDEAKKSGFYDTFSDEDLNQIKGDVAYGDSMLAGKKEWAAAKTPEEKKAIEDKFANERLQRGYYNTVSGDGKGGYRATSTTMANIGGGAQPMSKFSSINHLLAEIAGDKFSYDPKSDKRYKLAEEYAQQAMAHQMAESALLTGGYGNSYAANIGQQVYNDYMDSAVNDMEDRAYAKWAAERDNKYNLLGIVRDMEQEEYNREQTERQWAYQEEQNKKTEEDNARTDARNTVYDHIQNGGSIADLSPELIAATGWDEAFIQSIIDKRDSDNAVSDADKNRAIYDAQIESMLASYGSVADIPAEIIAGSSYANNLPLLNQLEQYYKGIRAAEQKVPNNIDFSQHREWLIAAGATDYNSAFNLVRPTVKSDAEAEAIVEAAGFKKGNFFSGVGNFANNVKNTIAMNNAKTEIEAIAQDNALMDIDKYYNALKIAADYDLSPEETAKLLDELKIYKPDYEDRT